MPNKPVIDCDRFHPVLRVPDVPAAVEFYTRKLGFEVGFTWGEPMTMAGVNLGKVQVMIERGTPAPQGAAVYFVVGNADELHDFHKANGVKIIEPPGDRMYELRDYGVEDLNGYYLSFGHYIYSGGDPVYIEREAVTVRLEKRLAAVLRDLAEYKHLSVTSCLEEILCHTNEPLGDGVACPHTAAQLRQIQELKKKHGIDYDSHGSYRFVEK